MLIGRTIQEELKMEYGTTMRYPAALVSQTLDRVISTYAKKPLEARAIMDRRGGAVGKPLGTNRLEN
jgi:hypothetical protein